MIIIMLVRPEGLWPSRRRRAELHPSATISEQENAGLQDAERTHG